jgi:hypothetical protein
LLGRECQDGYIIDHIDGDSSNNSLNNLRCITQRENVFNSKRCNHQLSPMVGVGYCKTKRLWRARIVHNGKIKHIGYYDTPQEAQAARLATAKVLRGDFI